MSWKKFNLTCSGLALALSLSSAAEAQSAGNQPTPDSQATPATAAQPVPDANPVAPQASAIAPGDIVVTARRREERLLDTPVAITAVTQQQLARYDASSLSSIATEVPQLVVNESQGAGSATLSLRGLSAGTNPTVDQPVSLNIDGIQVSQSIAIRIGEFDLSRVEVLKGPQALFFGKNSPAGIISLISNNPTDTLGAQFRTGYEFAQQQKFAEAIVNVPLAEGLGLRIVAYGSGENGWFRNDAPVITGPNYLETSPGAGPNDRTGPKQSEVFTRATLAYVGSNGVKITLKGAFSRVDRPNNSGYISSQYYYCPMPNLNSGTDCKLDRYYQAPEPRPADVALDPADLGGSQRLLNKQGIASLSVDVPVTSDIVLSSISGYYTSSNTGLAELNGSLPNIVVPTTDQSVDQVTQELRLQSSFSGHFNFLVGAYYQNSSSRVRTPVFFGGLGVIPIDDFRLRTDAASGFAQATYKFTDQLELSAGGRYSYERKELGGTRTPLGGTPTGIVTARNSRDFTNFSPEVTLRYRPTPRLMIYGSYKTGFTSGGYNTTPSLVPNPAVDISYGQTTVKGGEIGAKGTLLDGQVTFDGTIYDYKYKGLQLTTLSFDGPFIETLTQSVGGATLKGVEFNLVVRPHAFAGLELRGDVAYNSARYTNFIGNCYSGQSVAQGCNLQPTIAAGSAAAVPLPGTATNPYNSQDETGKQLYVAPAWTATMGATYDHALTSNYGLSVSADGRYTGSYFSDAEDSPHGRQNSVFTIDANLTLYRGQNRDIQLSLIGRNLTQQFRVTSTIIADAAGTGTNASASGNYYGSITEPRTLLLQLTVKTSMFK